MAKKKDSDSLSVEIKEQYGFLNDKQNKVFAKVVWGDNSAKFDIRKCYEKDGELKLGSGISLSEDELNMLVKLNEARRRKEKEREVDFDDIFRSAAAIEENRAKGFQTENGGFIRLHPKKKLK